MYTRTIYTHTYTHMCTHIDTYLHSCQHGRIHTQTDMQTSTRTHPHNDIPTYMHTCIYAYILTITHTHTYAHTDMVLRTRTHTHTHTETHHAICVACSTLIRVGTSQESLDMIQVEASRRGPWDDCFFNLLGSLMSMSQFVCRKMLWPELCQKGVKRHRRRPSVPLQRSALSL